MALIRKFLLLWMVLSVFVCAMAQQTTDEQLAMQYYKDAEYEKAGELFEKIQITKKNAYIYYYYYQTLFQLRDFDQMEKLAKKQCKLFPDQLRYRVDLGYVYEISNQIGKAEKEYQAVLKDIQPKDYSVRDVYNSFLTKGKREYALDALMKGRKLLGDDKLYAKEITGIYSQLGRSDKLFEEAVSLVKDNEEKYIPQCEEIIQNALLDDENAQKYETIKNMQQKNMQKYPEND
ncbi:MAG: hypothetical protein MJZ46_02340, partial [Bacteroidales bacterium]|nr:hypothetical protein [Bacteroidales bacterium]